MSTLSSTSASRTCRRFAGALAMVLVAATAAAVPFAALRLPAVQGFLPSFGAATVVLNALTAFLLAMQFAMRRTLAGALLAGAYGFVVPVVALQVLVFPGAPMPAGELEAQAAWDAAAQGSAWLWIFWHAGFALLVLAAVMAGERVVRSDAGIGARVGGIALAALPMALAGASGWLALVHGARLGELVRADGYGALWHGPVGAAVWTCNAVALFAVVRATRLRTVLHLWLAVALVAAQADITLALVADARFTLGWYCARAITLLSVSAVLGALLWEVNALYRRMAASNDMLVEMATRDALTGLFNRRHLDLRLAQHLREARGAGQPVAMLLLDIDHFKSVNDTFGHAAGDAALKAVAAALSSRLRRSGDLIARYGGEEFAVVLPGAGADAALGLAERLRQAVADMAAPEPIAGRALTVSIGAAVCLPEMPADADQLAAQADTALYAAKRAGRNRVRAAWMPATVRAGTAAVAAADQAVEPLAEAV